MGKKVEATFYSGMFIMWFYTAQLLALLPYRHDLKNSMFVISIVSNILSVGILLLIDKIKNKSIFYMYRIPNISLILRYIFYGIGMYLLSLLFIKIIGPYFPQYGQQIKDQFFYGQNISRFIALVIMTPIAEEYFFRGKILESLSHGFSLNLSIILQAIIFALMHPIVLQQIYAFIIGTGFGYMRYKEKDITGSTLAHMTFNFIGWYIGMSSLA